MFALTGASALLNQVASDLRILLDCPEGWVGVFADEDLGIVVGIALNMEIEDVGDAENGPRISAAPSRFVYLVHSEDNGWDMVLHDTSLVNYEAASSGEAEAMAVVATLHLTDLDRTPWTPRVVARVVAEKVVAILRTFDRTV